MQTPTTTTTTTTRLALFRWQIGDEPLAGTVRAERGTLETRTMFWADRFGTLRTHDGMPILALHGPQPETT
jgi:hypothetical protein